jgi:RimJ/RimL family protein N-acetyltransferase
LEDDAIVLRPWRESDLDDSVVACADPEVVRWISRIPTPYSEQDAREFLELVERGWVEGTSFGFAMTERATGHTVGSIGLSVNGAIGEVGYFVFAGHRCRGIGERALRLIAGWALGELELARLQLIVMIGNDASACLAEKVGFKREGILRSWLDNRGTRADVTMYSLLPADIGSGSGGS